MTIEEDPLPSLPDIDVGGRFERRSQRAVLGLVTETMRHFRHNSPASDPITGEPEVEAVMNEMERRGRFSRAAERIGRNITGRDQKQ